MNLPEVDQLKTLFEAKVVLGKAYLEIERLKKDNQQLKDSEKQREKIAYDVACKARQMVKDSPKNEDLKRICAGVSSALIELGYGKQEEQAYNLIVNNVS